MKIDFLSFITTMSTMSAFIPPIRAIISDYSHTGEWDAYCHSQLLQIPNFKRCLAFYITWGDADQVRGIITLSATDYKARPLLIGPYIDYAVPCNSVEIVELLLQWFQRETGYQYRFHFKRQIECRISNPAVLKYVCNYVDDNTLIKLYINQIAHNRVDQVMIMCPIVCHREMGDDIFNWYNAAKNDKMRESLLYYLHYNNRMCVEYDSELSKNPDSLLLYKIRSQMSWEDWSTLYVRQYYDQYSKRSLLALAHVLTYGTDIPIWNDMPSEYWYNTYDKPYSLISYIMTYDHIEALELVLQFSTPSGDQIKRWLNFSESDNRKYHTAKDGRKFQYTRHQGRRYKISDDTPPFKCLELLKKLA